MPRAGVAAPLLVLVLLSTACSSIGVGVSVPIGRSGSIGVGGSVPLPRPSEVPASAPEPAR